jgi:hypothetical protein
MLSDGQFFRSSEYVEMPDANVIPDLALPSVDHGKADFHPLSDAVSEEPSQKGLGQKTRQDRNNKQGR